MDFYELPFAKIIFVRDDIAEVIINDGIEVDAAMVEQYHNVLLSHLRPPFSVLVNKINSYAYDFAAKKKLASLAEVNAIAIVAYNQVSITTTEALAAIPREHPWYMTIFSNRSDALAWLLAEQDQLNNQIKFGG